MIAFHMIQLHHCSDSWNILVPDSALFGQQRAFDADPLNAGVTHKE